MRAVAEKAEERDPVLRIGDSEFADGREKEKVKGERGGDRSEGCFDEPPGARDHQYQQQVREADCGRIVRNYEIRAERDDSHAREGNEQAQRQPA